MPNTWASLQFHTYYSCTDLFHSQQVAIKCLKTLLSSFKMIKLRNINALFHTKRRVHQKISNGFWVLKTEDFAKFAALGPSGRPGIHRPQSWSPLPEISGEIFCMYAKTACQDKWSKQNMNVSGDPASIPGIMSNISIPNGSVTIETFSCMRTK
jgi:hypothetical protein